MKTVWNGKRIAELYGWDAEFKESDHPRDADGKFGSGGAAKRTVEALHERYPVNPANPKERLFMAAGKKAGDFEIDEREGRLRIRSIQSDEPGSGIGTLILKRILKQAERDGVTVELTASSKGNRGLSTEQLKRWYGKHGFVPEPGFDPALGYMLKKP
jgi:GNAT superfamily N-acetyltransferase